MNAQSSQEGTKSFQLPRDAGSEHVQYLSCMSGPCCLKLCQDSQPQNSLVHSGSKARIKNTHCVDSTRCRFFKEIKPPRESVYIHCCSLPKSACKIIILIPIALWFFTRYNCYLIEGHPVICRLWTKAKNVPVFPKPETGVIQVVLEIQQL